MKANRRRAQSRIERLEGRLFLAAHTWTGGGVDANWSDAANWTGGVPSAAESDLMLDFPAGASQTAANNDIAGLTIQSISLEGSYWVHGQGFSLASSIGTASISTSAAGGGSLDNDITLASDVTLNLPGQLNVGGVISGADSLELTSGTVYINGHNTYTGSTTVDSGGLLYLGSGDGLGTGAANDVVVDSGGAILLDLGVNCAKPLMLEGAGSGFPAAALYPREATSGAATTVATWSGSVWLNGDTSLAGRPASDGGVNGVQTTLAITGNISGNGNLTISGGGVELDGANIFGGATTVAAGSLVLNSSTGGSVPNNLSINGGSVESKQSGQFTAGDPVAVASGATLTLDSGVTETVDGFACSGTYNGAGTLVDDNGGTETLNGTITGQASLTIAGGQTFNDPASNTSDTIGTITLSSASNLVLDGSLPNATIDLAGGFLSGTGTAGSLTGSGGEVAAVDAFPGTIHLTGDLDLGSGTTDGWIASDASTCTTLDVAGSVTLGGSLDFQGGYNGYRPAAGTVFTIIHNAGGQPVSGTFQGDPEGTVFTVQGQEWKISYVGGSGGHDVTATDLGYPSAIAVASDDAVAAYGTVVLHATVTTPAYGAPTPTGTVTFTDGATTLGTATLDNSGVATFAATSLQEGDHTITASYAGGGFFEASGPSSLFTQTVTPPPEIDFTDASVLKPASGTFAVEFDVMLSDVSSLPVTLHYTTQDGSALAGRDYTATSGTLTFAPGETEKTVDVPVTGGPDWQPDRSFTLAISSVTNAVAATTSASGIIGSTDGLPTSGIVPDELDPSQNDLVAFAPVGNNSIQVKTVRGGVVQAVINRRVVASGLGIDRVIVYGGPAGTNTVTAPTLNNGLIFFGGAGRNVVTGGRGNDILVGSAGQANVFAGGGGMNLLIGSGGNATLHGSAAGDVLVGGATNYDVGTLSSILSLETLLAEWTAPGAFADRAAALAAADPTTGAALDESTVTFNAHDHVTGRKNHDDLIVAPAPVRRLAAVPAGRKTVGHRA